jgi:hypothetical protein
LRISFLIAEAGSTFQEDQAHLAFELENATIRPVILIAGEYSQECINIARTISGFNGKYTELRVSPYLTGNW